MRLKDRELSNIQLDRALIYYDDIVYAWFENHENST